jgi:hypothetical protein
MEAQHPKRVCAVGSARQDNDGSFCMQRLEQFSMNETVDRSGGLRDDRVP